MSGLLVAQKRSTRRSSPPIAAVYPCPLPACCGSSDGWSGRAKSGWRRRALGHPLNLIHSFILESLSSGVRGAAFMVPGALGAQESGMVLFGALLGLPADLALAVSLTKRVRELALGLPGLAAWQWVEGPLTARSPDGSGELDPLNLIEAAGYRSQSALRLQATSRPGLASPAIGFPAAGLEPHAIARGAVDSRPSARNCRSRPTSSPPFPLAEMGDSAQRPRPDRPRPSKENSAHDPADGIADRIHDTAEPIALRGRAEIGRHAIGARRDAIDK